MGCSCSPFKKWTTSVTLKRIWRQLIKISSLFRFWGGGRDLRIAVGVVHISRANGGIYWGYDSSCKTPTKSGQALQWRRKRTAIATLSSRRSVTGPPPACSPLGCSAPLPPLQAGSEVGLARRKSRQLTQGWQWSAGYRAQQRQHNTIKISGRNQTIISRLFSDKTTDYSFSINKMRIKTTAGKKSQSIQKL